MRCKKGGENVRQSSEKFMDELLKENTNPDQGKNIEEIIDALATADQAEKLKNAQ